MINLRPYQSELIHKVRVSLREVKSVLLQAPTGAGKTILATKMMQNSTEKNNTCFFVVHRQELVDQTAQVLDSFDLSYGIIASNYTPNPIPRIQICSIQTLKNKLRSVKKPAIIIFDEGHHCISASWVKVMEYFSGAKIIGLTATPCRLDGKGLSNIFDKLVLGPSVSWLMETVNPDTGLNYLSGYKLFRPNAPDLTGIKTIAGDYDKKELSKIMDNNTIIGDAITHYKKYADNKQAIAFCASIDHSKHTAQLFNEAGYNAAHLDGCTSKEERRQIIDDFKAGIIKILCNVDIVGEGFNVPAVQVCIMLRPTQSLTIYLQQVGRCLRPEQDKEFAIILDHAGNSIRHGLPDDEREWTKFFDGAKKRKSKTADFTPRQKMCDQCYCIHKPAPKCPDCGNVYIVVSRELNQTEGELVEVNKNLNKQLARQERLREQSQAITLEQLIALGKKRGYKETWASNLFNFRQLKKKG